MCDTESLAELTQALMTIGQMMGALIFPSLSGMYTLNACADPEGGGGGAGGHKFIGLPSNTGPDPLKNHKAIMLGHHGHASETPFKWRFAGGQTMARF